MNTLTQGLIKKIKTQSLKDRERRVEKAPVLHRGDLGSIPGTAYSSLSSARSDPHSIYFEFEAIMGI